MFNNWLIWALLAAGFAAVTAILAKIGLRDADPDFAQLVRTAVVLGVLLAFILASGKWHGASLGAARTWIYMILAGLATAGSWMCYFRALQAGQAGRVAAIDKLSVAMVAVIAAVVLQERMGVAGWVGVALTVAGAALIALQK